MIRNDLTSTRLHCCKAYKSRIVAKVSPTEGIRVDKGDGRNSVLASIYRIAQDEQDHFTVLTECESRKFFDVKGHAWAFTGPLAVLPRRTCHCGLLQMTRDAFGAMAEAAEQPSSGIRCLCVNCDISAVLNHRGHDGMCAAFPVHPFRCLQPHARASTFEGTLRLSDRDDCIQAA